MIQPKAHRNFTQLFAPFILGLLLISCQKREDAGPLVTIWRTLPAYSQLEIRGSYDVEIVPGNGSEVMITAPGNLMPFLETYVIGNTLVIDERNNHIRDNKPVHIQLSQRMLSRVELAGSGSVLSDTLFGGTISLQLSGSGRMTIPVSANALKIDLSGSGNIVATGLADHVDIEIDGSGNVLAQSVYAFTASAKIAGSGNAKVFTSESLYARITGSGNVYFWGMPVSVDSYVTGSGQVIKM